MLQLGTHMNLPHASDRYVRLSVLLAAMGCSFVAGCGTEEPGEATASDEVVSNQTLHLTCKQSGAADEYATVEGDVEVTEIGPVRKIEEVPANLLDALRPSTLDQGLALKKYRIVAKGVSVFDAPAKTIDETYFGNLFAAGGRGGQAVSTQGWFSAPDAMSKSFALTAKGENKSQGVARLSCSGAVPSEAAALGIDVKKGAAYGIRCKAEGGIYNGQMLPNDSVVFIAQLVKGKGIAVVPATYGTDLALGFSKADGLNAESFNLPGASIGIAGREVRLQGADVEGGARGAVLTFSLPEEGGRTEGTLVGWSINDGFNQTPLTAKATCSSYLIQ